MRIVIQRVKQASVEVNSETVGQIGEGILIFLGVGEEDTEEDVRYTVDKSLGLRIFEDEGNKMNLSVKDVGGEVLIVSQFTLYGDCRKGRRPSFDKAASPELAENLYELFIQKVRENGIEAQTGKFGEFMDVSLINSGPVTILLDSKKVF